MVCQVAYEGSRKENNRDMVSSAIGYSKVVNGRDCIYTDLGQVGFALFGPYETYDAGTYAVSFRISMSQIEKPLLDASLACCYLEVTTDFGDWVLVRRPVRVGELGVDPTDIVLDFTLRQRKTLEFRVYTLGIAPLIVEEERPVLEPPERRHQFHDHSQNGEVRMLLREMISRTVAHTIVVDVGAYGRSGSNSYDLMRHFGWRGLLIEPNPVLCDRISREFFGLQFNLVNAAVSSHEGTGTLYLGVHDEISSIHRDMTAHWGEVRSEVSVSVRRLPSILAENHIPFDFGVLSIDAEGEGLNIFEDIIAAGYFPKWVIMEVYDASNYASLDQFPVAEWAKARYRLVGKTAPNIIIEAV
jgi:FkbM family methyltransferase